MGRSVAPHDDLKALAVERQLSQTCGLGIGVRSHFDAIKLVSSRFQNDNGKSLLPERVGHRESVGLTRRSCYLQQDGTNRNERSSVGSWLIRPSCRSAATEAGGTSGGQPSS